MKTRLMYILMIVLLVSACSSSKTTPVGTTVATNGNPFTVRNANIAGTLIDAAGQIVSVGSTLVLGEIAPGASVSFDLRIPYEPYTHYRLYAQAQHN